MKILFLQNRLLLPPDTGGKIRTLNVLRYLARWHQVTYLCNLLPGEEAYADAMRPLGLRVETVPWRSAPRGGLRFWSALAGNLLSPCPVHIARHYNPALRERARQLAGRERFDLVVCDFLQVARHAEGICCPARLLFQHNVEAEILRRHARTDESLFRRRYLALQAWKMRRFEAAAGHRFDAVVAVSERDRQTFEQEYGWRHVHVIDTAVDLDNFRPAAAAGDDGRVVFVGALDWLPNQDGVRHFVRRVWPLVLRERPDAAFQVVGRNPPAELLRLGEEPGVEVVGTVPDVRPYLAGAAAVVVPLLVGGGTRLKIFEALAMGKAVVSTTVGAEGLPITPGEHFLLADSPADFARAVTRLLDSPGRREELGRAGRGLVTERYGAETVARQFEAICLQTVGALLRRQPDGDLATCEPEVVRL